jgi:hypothetical protein
MPTAGRVIQRSRPPFTDGVARALAHEASLQALAQDHDPFDCGLRDAWETIIVTGRRCSEVLELRLDCLGRYGGLPMLWHDQTKVGSYDEAIRIPERTSQLLEARQRKTLDLFRERNNRPPAPGERAAMALFPTNFRNRDCRHALSYAQMYGVGPWWRRSSGHSWATPAGSPPPPRRSGTPAWTSPCIPPTASAPRGTATFASLNILPVPWVEANDVSNAVLWLASDEARYVTGMQFTIDAGCTERTGSPQPES